MGAAMKRWEAYLMSTVLVFLTFILARWGTNTDAKAAKLEGKVDKIEYIKDQKEVKECLDKKVDKDVFIEFKKSVDDLKTTVTGQNAMIVDIWKNIPKK